MASFDPFKPALVCDLMNNLAWEWPGVPPAKWEEGASWHKLAGETIVNWRGLLLRGWQPVDDTTPRRPLPDDCRP